MTQDEIIEMARQAWISEQEAQLITEFDMAYISCTYLTDLVAFAELVAAAAASKEREACARYFDEMPSREMFGGTVADEIRARGEA